MTGFLRFVGILNAAVWLGAAVAFSFAALPAMFSQEMNGLLQQNYPYFSGAIAQLLVARYFSLQLICGALALLHLLVERMYLGKSLRKIWYGLVLALFAAALAGNYWLQPKMKELHRTKYAVNLRPEARDAAARSFRAWHGASQAVNLLMLSGLIAYLWRVSNASDEPRFVSTVKFRS